MWGISDSINDPQGHSRDARKALKLSDAEWQQGLTTRVTQSRPYNVLVLTLATLVCAMAAVHQTPAAPVQVMIVGTFHMAGGGDMINPNVKDILGERRQREMMVLVDKLSAFKPTKIGVERVYGSPDVQKRLDDFRAGSVQLGKSEVDQITLRVAQKSGVREMFGIDWKKGLDVMGVLDHSEKTGQGHIKRWAMEIVAKEIMPLSAKMETQTLLEIFRENNEPAWDDRMHGMYQALAEVGKDEDYKGADMAADWYERNLKIAVNIRRISKPGDRVFVLIGAGHCKLLREFLGQTPGFKVVSALDYLK